MKSIVFIIYDMLPHSNSWGGCQRMYFLAKQLLKEGYNVKVFAVNSNKYNTYGKELLPNVVHTYPLPKEGNGASISSSSRSSIKDIQLLRKIYQKTEWLLFNEIIPGIGFRSYNRCNVGKKSIEKDLSENEYDIAIISAPPFNVFSYINVVKKVSPSTKIIMDYRDPWNSWHSNNPVTTHREKILQRKADIIVCTNDALCADMSQKFGIPRTKYHTISNGYMTTEGESNKEGVCLSHNLNIVYTGTVCFGPYREEYRDTANLIEAIRQLKSEGIENFRFTFVGIGDLNDPAIINLKNELGDLIEFVGVVSSTKANQYVDAAEVALVMHTAEDNSGKFLISGKLYDYIHNKKFILSIGREDGQHAVLLRKYKIGINAVNRVDEIKACINRCIELWANNQLDTEYENLDVTIFSRDYQVKKYCKIINEM